MTSDSLPGGCHRHLYDQMILQFSITGAGHDDTRYPLMEDEVTSYLVVFLKFLTPLAVGKSIMH